MSDTDAIISAASKNVSNRTAIQSLRSGNQSSSAYNEAMNDLSLTPQEQFLYQHHLNNLMGTGKVVHPNGDISTLYQLVVTGPNGKFYNIPSVWNGRIVTPQEAQTMAGQVGWDKWPSYESAQAADDRYGKMHEYLDKDALMYRKNNPEYMKAR